MFKFILKPKVAMMAWGFSLFLLVGEFSFTFGDDVLLDQGNLADNKLTVETGSPF